MNPQQQQSSNNIFGGGPSQTYNAYGGGNGRGNTANQGNGVKDALNYNQYPAPKIATTQVRVSNLKLFNKIIELQDLRKMKRSLFKFNTTVH